MGSRTHGVFAGFLLLEIARRGIVVLFDRDVHVHICHHLARHHRALYHLAHHLAHVRHRSVVTKRARRVHLGGMLAVIEEKYVGREDTVSENGDCGELPIQVMGAVAGYRWVG